jgi:hypothetical protein
MIKIKSIIIGMSLLTACTFLTIPTFAKEKLPAFPGAEGYARYITGGRGGTVYHVTSLADDGSAGTFRWAVNKSGTRTIVFDVSGTIHLTSALYIQQANVTIAGQTAPGDGICVTDYPCAIKTNNVIVRYMRFRLGNSNVTVDGADGWDGFGGFDQSNIMIDHCSISWSIDECCSVLGNNTSTVQWCLVSQSLQDAGHSKGSHGYGGNWGGTNASFHHNLMCHHESRVPRLGPRPTTQMNEHMDMRNNVLYNWGGNGCYGGENMNVNIVNNYYKPGPATLQRGTPIQMRIAGIGIRTTEYCTNSPSYAPALHKWGHFFVDGNVNTKYPTVTNDNWTYGIYNQISSSDNDNLYTQATKDTMKLTSPLDFIHTTTHTAAMAYEKVVKYAGCCISRDWLDTLMIHDTRYGVATYTGTSGKFSGDATNRPGIIDSQEDNKPANASADWSPWPTLNSTAAPTDTDGDGMPDAYETANGLNPNSATDGSLTNAEGYTNLELYLNSLVANITTDELADGTVMGDDVESTETVTSTTYELSSATSSTNTASEYTFTNGFSITNAKSKSYGTGSNNGIKYSSGVQYTIVIPSGLSVSAIEISGYDNYAETDAYIGELNGVTYTSSDYVFPQKDADGNAITKDYTIQLATPATEKLTFTPKGKQVVWKIILTASTSTGVNKIVLDTQTKRVDIYTIDGKIIKRNASISDLSTLQHGTYIVDNKKIHIK